MIALRAFLFSLLIFNLALSLEIKLSKEASSKIAQKIWKNEGSSQKRQLVWWNKGEEFASCGIGHFIWYAKNRRMWFKESFPAMLKFLIKNGAKPPKWLTPNTPCVWSNFKEWQKAKATNSPKMRELTNFLDKTKDLQAKFMLKRLNEAYPKILAYAKARGQGKILEYNYKRLLYNKDGSINPLGAYSLIDYINFKGDGITKSERYQGKGWGLYQVLVRMDMREKNPHKAFRDATKIVLERLIKISPPKRRLWRFKKGWLKRIDTYLEK